MTPGSFLILSGALILVAVSAADAGSGGWASNEASPEAFADVLAGLDAFDR